MSRTSEALLSVTIVLLAPVLVACQQQDGEAAPRLRDRPDLIPPRAEYSEPDEQENPLRVVLEIDQAGRVWHGGEVWQDPDEDGASRERIRALLRRLRAEPERTTRTERVHGRPFTLVNDPILLRADRHTPWYCIGQLMFDCSQPDIAFWKIELGFSETGEYRSGSPTKVPAYLPRDSELPFEEIEEIEEAEEIEEIEAGGGQQVGVVGGQSRETARTSEPVEFISLRIVCDDYGTQSVREVGDESEPSAAFDLSDHDVHWEVGPVRLAAIDDLREHLAKLAKDPASRDPEGKLRAVVIEAGPDCTYGDVAVTLDATHAAGLSRVHFGGGGPGRRGEGRRR